MNNIYEFIDGRYLGETFKVAHYHPADVLHETAWLECVSNSKIVMTSYVKMKDLRIVQQP